MYAYSSILAALIQRGKTGKGCRIDVSMLESMVEWMSYPLYYAYDGATPPPRAGAAHATIYPYGPFPAGDGKTVMLGLQNEREWAAFCKLVLQQPELATDERFASNSQRVANRQALRALIDEVFLALNAEQVIARLERSADRQRAHERHARRVEAPAAEGTRPLDRGATRRAGRSPRCCRRARPMPSSPAWTRCRGWASTPTPSSSRLGWSRTDIRRLRREGAI